MARRPKPDVLAGAVSEFDRRLADLGAAEDRADRDADGPAQPMSWREAADAGLTLHAMSSRPAPVKKAPAKKAAATKAPPTAVGQAKVPTATKTAARSRPLAGLTAVQLAEIRGAFVETIDAYAKRDGRAQARYFAYGLVASLPLGVLAGYLTNLIS